MTTKQHKRLIYLLNWLDKFVYTVLSDPSIRVNRQKIILSSQVAKMHTTFGAIVILIQKGYGPDAMLLMRSMFNNLVNILWINTTDQKHRAELFINYYKIIRKNKLEIIKRYPERATIFSRLLTEEGDIYKTYSEINSDFPDIYRWSNKSIKQMSKEVGLLWDYDFVYPLASSIEHADVESVDAHINQVDNQEKVINFQAGPSLRLIVESSIASAKYMMFALEAYIDKFKIGKKFAKKLQRYDKRIAKHIKGL